MNMPGFTAEASLHHGNVRYQTATKTTFRGGIVQPAQGSDVFYPNKPVFSLAPRFYDEPIFCLTWRCGPGPGSSPQELTWECHHVVGFWDPVTARCKPF